MNSSAVNSSNKLIVILGPTASGKSAMSIEVAKAFKAPIISADARQIYKGLDIGTAKILPHEQAGIPHYFIDHITIHEPYSVGDYEREVLVLLEQLFQQHPYVILTGGTGLYIKAMCEGLAPIPKVDPQIRQGLERGYQQKGLVYLQEQLKEMDPIHFQQMDQQNPHRLMQAISVFLTTNKSLREWQELPHKPRFFSTIKIGLHQPRELLYQKINDRVDQMIDKGLLEEAEKFYVYKHLQALQTVGYQELFEFMDGNITLSNAVDLIKRNSRRYAKRQLTWWRKDDVIHWYLSYEVKPVIDFLYKMLPT